MSSNDNGCNSTVPASLYVATTASFAVVGSLGCMATIVMVIQSEVYRSYIHRLTLYLAITSLFTALSTGIAVLPVDTNSTPLSLREGSGWNGTCVAFGFLVQYFTFSSTFATVWISSNVFALVMCRVQITKQRKCDVAGLLFIFLLPLLVAWIPFINDTFGRIAVWCWVKDRCYKGPGHTLEFQLGATAGPVFVLYLGSLVLIAFICGKFIAGYFGKRRHDLRQKNWEVLKELMPLVIYALACCLVYMFALFSSLYFVQIDKRHGALAVAIIICSLQTVRFLLPVVALLHPSVKRRITTSCRNLFKRRGSAGDCAAYVREEGEGEASTCVISEVDPLLQPAS